MKILRRRTPFPRIGLDLGNTVFDTTKPLIPFKRGLVMPECKGSIHTITTLGKQGYDFAVVSKIERGHEAHMLLSLFHCKLIPHVIAPAHVRFCHTRSEKGPLLKELKVDIHVDDRSEVLVAAHAHGVPHKILFVGVRDDRTEPGYFPPSFEDLHIASSWEEVRQIIEKISADIENA